MPFTGPARRDPFPVGRAAESGGWCSPPPPAPLAEGFTAPRHLAAGRSDPSVRRLLVT